MEKVKYPQERVRNTPVKSAKKRGKKKSKKLSRVYCVVCRSSYLNKNGQDHMHSVQHHRELQAVMGRPSCHNCQACNESSMSLNEYEEHISTAQHKAKLNILKSRNVKPVCLIKTLGTELMTQVLNRNKTLKMSKKKTLKKKKKKEKQLAGQRQAEQAQQARKMTAVSKGVKPVNKSILKQVQGTQKEASQKAVVQNEKNKVAWRGSAAQTWQHTPAREQFSQSSYRVVPSGNLQVAGFSHCSRVDSYKMDISFKRFQNTQGFARTLPEHIAWPAISKHNNNYYNRNTRYNSVADFTSDQLPPHTSIIFDYSQNQNTGPYHPRREGLAQPAPASKPADTAPIRDVDVGSMLWQIRRALGVREPCRAEREARRQSSSAGAGAQDEQSTGGYAKEAAPGISSTATTPAQSSTSRSLVSVSNSGVRPSVAKPKDTTVTSVDKPSRPCDKSSVAASNTDQALDSHNLVGQSSTPVTFPESNPNISHKVRIAHQPSKVQKGKDETFLGSSAEARENLSWSRKKELEKGLNRFGMKSGNPDQDTSVQVEDTPLSEGFHWESVPHNPPDTHCTKLPPQPPDTTWTQPQADTRTDSQTHGLPEQSGATQDAGNKQVSKGVSVKVEVIQDDENEDVAEHNRVAKRKHKVVTLDDELEDETKRKKKKGKSNKGQDQMDQLLAVSLREEELSQSLQDLDKCLIQARNALQAAYTEVQRLLLVRQQCTAEVNSLRAKRIEILQGMKGVYSGESKVAERATALPAGAAVAAVQPRLSPLPSSSAFPASARQHLPHPVQTFSINPLSLPSVPVKQEPCKAPAVSTSLDTPQVPVNQPVSLFPPDLLPPLLLTLPSLAAPTTPTTSVSSVKKLKSDDPISASPPVSAQQQEQVTREESVKTVSAAVEEDDSDSEGENIRPAVEKPVSTVVPERNQNAASTNNDDEGDESDDSVQMVGPSNQEVIAIDDSDTEETAPIIPQEPPAESASVELSSASTQTLQQIDAERKPEPKYVPKKEAAVPHECADVAECEEPSTGAFENHQGPVHGLQVHEGLLYTCSGDNTARAYSLINRECLAVFKGHTNKINCLLVSASHPNMPARLFTGSSDQTIRCYSIKSKKCLDQISLSDRVLCLHTAWNVLYAGLASGSVASYDFKTLKQLDVFECHGPRGVSCLGTAQEGARRVLLVGSYDSTISVRDAKNGLLLRSLEGHTKTVLCMKVVNDLVFSGSSDTSVHAHNIHTGELVRIYKGHGHAVTSIVILGKVMVTACLDELVRVYELQSHDRLQVYGGHSDMVMCMAVHKSVIYTGCYDGSVQAVKLNLMKNYRCWWQNCSLIFGIKDHLLQHLIKDHTNPSLEAVRCRWKGCTTFFARQQEVKQELPEHMRSHLEKDSEVQP